MKITISKNMWEKIGFKSGFLKTSNRKASLLKIAYASVKEENEKYYSTLYLLKSAQTAQEVVKDITADQIMPFIDMRGYNDTFVLEQPPDGEPLSPEGAREVFANAIVFLIKKYPREQSMSLIVAHLKANRGFTISAFLEKVPSRLYLVPAFNNSGIMQLKSDFTGFVTNNIGSLHSHGKLTISDKARRSGLIGTRMEKDKAKIPMRVVRTANDAISFAYFAGILSSFGKIKFYPKEFTGKGEKMVEVRGKGERYKTTATFELGKQVQMDTDQIKNYLSFFTFQASEDTAIVEGKSNYLLAWKAECAFLCNSLGIHDDFYKMLEKVESYERSQASLDATQRNARSKVFVMEIKSLMEKIRNKVVKSQDVNAKVMEEYGSETHPITREESEAVLMDAFEKGVAGVPLT